MTYDVIIMLNIIGLIYLNNDIVELYYSDLNIMFTNYNIYTCIKIGGHKYEIIWVMVEFVYWIKKNICYNKDLFTSQKLVLHRLIYRWWET